MANLSLHNPSDVCIYDDVSVYNQWWHGQQMQPYLDEYNRNKAKAEAEGVIFGAPQHNERLVGAQKHFDANKLSYDEFKQMRVQACGDRPEYTVTPLGKIASDMETVALELGPGGQIQMPNQAQTPSLSIPGGGAGFQQVPAPPTQNGDTGMTNGNGAMVPTTNGNGYMNGNGNGLMQQFKTSAPWMQVLAVGGTAAILALVARAVMPKKKGRRR